MLLTHIVLYEFFPGASPSTALVGFDGIVPWGAYALTLTWSGAEVVVVTSGVQKPIWRGGVRRR